ncbi:MAG: hypothetical protein II719_05360 [Clostridia bacterium]|nr:hypothetical protein [Clostridia bacterium]
MLQTTEKNILIKLSGEAFGGEGTPFDADRIRAYAAAIRDGLSGRKRIFAVCGGGNVCRGRSFGGAVRADYAGMLASVQNGLFLHTALEEMGVSCQMVIPDHFEIPYGCHEADLKEETRVVLYCGGVGYPGHSTDYVCAVKSAFHHCDIYFAKMGVDGVYDRDPHKDPEHAVFLPELTFSSIAAEKLGVMDFEAADLLKDTDCRGYVFELTADNLRRMLTGDADSVHKTVIL